MNRVTSNHFISVLFQDNVFRIIIMLCTAQSGFQCTYFLRNACFENTHSLFQKNPKNAMVTQGRIWLERHVNNA